MAVPHLYLNTGDGRAQETLPGIAALFSAHAANSIPHLAFFFCCVFIDFTYFFRICW